MSATQYKTWLTFRLKLYSTTFFLDNYFYYGKQKIGWNIKESSSVIEKIIIYIFVCWNIITMVQIIYSLYYGICLDLRHFFHVTTKVNLKLIYQWLIFWLYILWITMLLFIYSSAHILKFTTSQQYCRIVYEELVYSTHSFSQL